MPLMTGKLTIKEIARLANVSKTTVSRVLNHKPDVDPATRERILHIIEEQRRQTTPWVGADNATGAYIAVRHLINLGHQHIAHIAGPDEYLVSHERYNGYRQALLEAGFIPDPDLVQKGDFMPPTGRSC